MAGLAAAMVVAGQQLGIRAAKSLSTAVTWPAT